MPRSESSIRRRYPMIMLTKCGCKDLLLFETTSDFTNTISCTWIAHSRTFFTGLMVAILDQRTRNFTSMTLKDQSLDNSLTNNIPMILGRMLVVESWIIFTICLALNRRLSGRWTWERWRSSDRTGAQQEMDGSRFLLSNKRCRGLGIIYGRRGKDKKHKSEIAGSTCEQTVSYLYVREILSPINH